mgnify:CR=1 FL=1
MAEIKVTVSDTQVKCLEYAAYSVQDWCDNAIHNRARLAQEEIIAKLVTHCNENSIALLIGCHGMPRPHLFLLTNVIIQTKNGK